MKIQILENLMFRFKVLTKIIGVAAVLTSLYFAGAANALAAGDYKPIKFEKETLPNGLKVIYYVDNSAPVVSTVCHYNVGSQDEDLNKTGFAHFFEHLMFEATDAIPRATIDKYVEEAGGDLNAYTSFDQTVFHFTLPSNELNLALWMEGQRMRKLHVDQIGVETQRGVVSEELKMRTLNQPYGTLLYKICKNMFPGSGYEWPTIGSIDHIANATIKDFKDFYDNFYQPNNATLVVAGDFKIEDAKKSVREYFGSYAGGNLPKRHEYILKPITKPYRETVIDDKAPMTALFIGFQAPSLLDADYYAMSILASILSEGESSRLYQRLVNTDQTAVQVEFSPFALRRAGAMLAEAFVAQGATCDVVEAAILDEINKVVLNGVSDQELEKAKNICETQFVFGKKDLLSIAQELAKDEVFFGDAGVVNTELSKYMAVSKEDISRVAKKYLATDNRVVLIYQPKDNQ